MEGGRKGRKRKRERKRKGERKKGRKKRWKESAISYSDIVSVSLKEAQRRKKQANKKSINIVPGAAELA